MEPLEIRSRITSNQKQRLPWLSPIASSYPSWSRVERNVCEALFMLSCFCCNSILKERQSVIEFGCVPNACSKLTLPTMHRESQQHIVCFYANYSQHKGSRSVLEHSARWCVLSPARASEKHTMGKKPPGYSIVASRISGNAMDFLFFGGGLVQLKMIGFDSG